MFSFKRTIFAGGALALVHLFGCRMSQKHATPPPSYTAPIGASHPKAVQPPLDSGDNLAPNILNWDDRVKKHYKQPGEFTAKFTFSLTNVSSEPVKIYATETSCE